jgi:hypothetical protein
MTALRDHLVEHRDEIKLIRLADGSIYTSVEVEEIGSDYVAGKGAPPVIEKPGTHTFGSISVPFVMSLNAIAAVHLVKPKK